MVREDLRPAAISLEGPEDVGFLRELVGSARFVLLGEASHGTHEFYRFRAEATKLLIEEFGFDAVAVEADWPDAFAVGCFIRGRGDAKDADDALRGFDHFPQWMWRNVDVRDLVAWLRDHNAAAGAEQQVGFYGLDLYSLERSMDAVIRYLDEVDPEAAERARSRYGCFERFGDDPQTYGYATGYGIADPCEEAVIEQLQEMASAVGAGSEPGQTPADEAAFYAEQNARVVRDAEEYYREMYRGTANTWNLRDRHMFETLEGLDRYLSASRGRPARIVVWAHNSHLGDARATSMSRRGELNLGQLVREHHRSDEVLLVGFTSFEGTVTAADDWGSPGHVKTVRPALPESYEADLHELHLVDLAVDLRREPARSSLRPQRLERAIGVIYRPGTERVSHYFNASLSLQFDVVIHLDRTRAVEPLEPA